jgi:outer membrane protein insertion porin family
MMTASLLLALAMSAPGAHSVASLPVAPVQDAASKPAALAKVCGMDVPPPARLPPAGSSPVVIAFTLCFEKQGGSSLIDPQTYLNYIQLKPSQPSLNTWVVYSPEVEQVILGDFQRLWGTHFLDDLAVELEDHVLSNGVIGKLVIFRMEERQRIRIVDYEGLSRVSRSAVDDKLKDSQLLLRLDSFIDAGLLKQVASTVRELYAEKGYQFANVKTVITPLAGETKLVNVTFNVTEGPKVAIRDVEFLGNRAVRDETLARAMEHNKAQGLLSVLGKGGTYDATRFEEDADRIVAMYRNRGFITARVGQPDVRELDDSADGSTRWIQLRVPVTEGKQYRIGTFGFEGNTIVKGEALIGLFKLRAGDIYREEEIRKGLDKARDIYGAGGYYEFTGYPDLQPRDAAIADPAGAQPAPAPADAGAVALPVVDVTLRLQEGKRFYVRRINFVGNTNTRDSVIRREVALLETGVFSSQALKQTVQRLNQLGYFKPLEGEAIGVEKAPGVDNMLDITLKVEEQNRNQLNFGAGASQYDGFFVNASFTTSNFMGRGETASVSVQQGSRSNNYQVAFSEPYLFNRPISGGAILFSRKVDYRLTSDAVDYSEVRTGFNLTGGLPLLRFMRGFVTYGYEIIDTASSEALRDAVATGTGTSTTSLLFLDDGRHTESSISPSIVYNTVDNPFAPRAGRKLTATYQYAGGVLGGTSDFIKPEIEVIQYVPLSRRTALGFRASVGQIRNYGRDLPYYLRYFMGGELQIRGTDIRTVGPKNANGVPIGGTKSLLFNAEYYVDVAPRVRALLFHDAGQAFAENERLDLRQLRTSSGAELRVTLPVIGVPFRLIYAWNIYRETTEKARTFKFAVGTTF